MRETLENHICHDQFEAFKDALKNLISFDTFINILRFALSKRAEKFISFLCQFQSSLTDGLDKDPYRTNTLQLFNLMGCEYAEYFQSNETTRQLRTNSLKRTRTFNNKKLLLASISGDLEVFKGMSSIRMDAGPGYSPYIAYAAANDQVELVRYLYPNLNYSSSSDSMLKQCDRSYWYKFSMVTALIQNANQVFDFLLQTHFKPNTKLSIHTDWPFSVLQTLRSYNNNLSFLHIAIALKRPKQFLQLIEKGEQFNDSVFQFAIDMGDINMIECCEHIGGQLPSNSLEKAIKFGHCHLIRYLLNKGFDLASVSSESSPLCLAVEYHQASVIEELIALNVDVLACNNRGEHALLLASTNYGSPIILQKLLDHLKVKLTAEELAAFLNRPITSSNQPILYYLADEMRKCEKNNQYGFDNLIIKAKILMNFGASLFTLCPSADSQAQFYCLSYSGKHPNLYFLNQLAIRQLCKIEIHTEEYSKIIFYLEEFFQKKDKNLSQNPFKSDMLLMSFIKHNFLATQKFKATMHNANMKDNIKFDFQDLFDPLLAFFMHRLNYTIMGDIIDKSIVNSQPGQLKHLFLCVDIFSCFYRVIPFTQYMLYVADTLLSKVSSAETDEATRWHDNQRLVLAKYIYETVTESADAQIQNEIKKCNDLITQLGTDLKFITPRIDPGQYAPMLTNKLISFAITYDRASSLVWLVKFGQSPSILKLLQLKNAKNHNELVRYSNEFIASCGDSRDTFRNSLSYDVPGLSAKIVLSLLLTKEPQDKIRSCLGIYLNHLKGNNPKKLLILTHILIHYKRTVAQPEKIMSVFVKALAELANIESNEADNFQSLIKKHPRNIILAFLQILLELVKLFNVDTLSLEVEIDTFRQEPDKEFLKNSLIINNKIYALLEKLIPPGHEELIATLNFIVYKRIVLKPSSPRMNFSSGADHTDLTIGKRYPSEDITNAESHFPQYKKV